ncbi:hypothetical protein J4731_16295 [Providencia rettgeri]|nr:hypothetical protein [Providencia rettgeri]
MNGQIKSNGGNLKLASASSIDNRNGIVHAQKT